MYNITHMHTQQPGLLDFINPLQSCEQLASTYRQWRLHQELLVSMECLVTCMTSDQLYNKFVPILFKYIANPVRKYNLLLCMMIDTTLFQDVNDRYLIYGRYFFVVIFCMFVSI